MLCKCHLAANCYFKKVDKNDAIGYTVTKLNAGATLIISRPSDTGIPNRIIIQDFSPKKDLSISLTGQAEPAPASVGCAKRPYLHTNNTKLTSACITKKLAL